MFESNDKNDDQYNNRSVYDAVIANLGYDSDDN